MRLVRGFKRRDQLLKLVEGHTGEIQELGRARLHIGESYTGHLWCLLLWEAEYTIIGITSIEERIEALNTVVESKERARLLREVGDHKFNNFAEIPLFWLFAEATVNPKYVAEYTLPGVITGVITHLEYVKLASE